MFWSMGTSNAQSPKFALSLSFEGIGLEDYAKGASSRIAEAMMDKDDFDQRMSELLRKAGAMSGDGMRVALILPNDQIKYTSIPCANDADPITINEHILKTLDGATPYAIDELRFDHHLRDGTLHVAAVALETLHEAEQFATQYGFEPLACIARTETEYFPVEVFFGLSDAPLGHMPRASIDHKDEPLQEDPTPIAFVRRETSDDTTIIASSAPLPVEARLSLTSQAPAPAPTNIQPIAATNQSLVAKQSELGAKIAARIAENNASQNWRRPVLTLALIAVFGGAVWYYLNQEQEIAQPDVAVLEPTAQQRTTPTDVAPILPLNTQSQDDDIARAPVSTMALPSPDLRTPFETESATLAPEGDEDIELAPDTDGATSNYSDLVLPFLTDPENIDQAGLERIYVASGIWSIAPTHPTTVPQVRLGDIYIASIDPSFEQPDAFALNPILNPFADEIMISPPSPAPEGTVFVLDDRGLVAPSADGTLSPDGHRVFSGLPNFRPPERPNLVDERAPVVVRLTNTGLPLNELKPRLPPTAENVPVVISAAAGIRPRLRPEELATPAAIESEIESLQNTARTSSIKPRLRPANLKIPVQTALTPQTRSRPSDETVTRQNSSSFVASEATVKDGINLRKLNVIGIYGSGTSRRALVRTATGRRIMVEVGDRLDGGRVAAIGESELRYVKSGRNVVLKLPKG